MGSERWVRSVEEGLATCPVHGDQEIADYGSTGGPDPYHVDHMACGHSVTCFGPGEPDMIIDYRTPRWKDDAFRTTFVQLNATYKKQWAFAHSPFVGLLWVLADHVAHAFRTDPFGTYYR